MADAFFSAALIEVNTWNYIQTSPMK